MKEICFPRVCPLEVQDVQVRFLKYVYNDSKNDVGAEVLVLDTHGTIFNLKVLS